MLVSLLVVFVSYTAEMQSRNVHEALLAARFGYLGKPFLVAAMFFLIMDYCRVHLNKWFSVFLLLLQTGFSFVVFTTEKHKLFYTSIEFVQDGIFPHLKLGHGPMYAAFMANMLLLCLAMFFVCFWQLGKIGSKQEKRQLLLFVAMIFAPLVSLGVFLTGIFQGYDCTLLGYLFSTIGFSISFLGLNMFDTVLLAREQVVDYLHCGLLVYDNRGRLIYHNLLADELNIVDSVEKIAENEEPYFFGDKVYSVENREIRRDNILYGHMYFIQDITERYRYEQELEKEKKRADEASEAKTEFLFSMSHDIRTPMNAILGMTKIAGLHLDNREKVADCLNKIDLSGQHLLELINAILDMNKIESGTLELYIEPFDMDEMLQEILTIATPLAQGMNHEFITQTEEIVHKAVCGDKSRLSQILTNIIGNAVKYTEKGGRIEFLAAEKQERYECSAAGATATFVFTVRDNGIGMSEEYLPHIFDPFTRASEDKIRKIQGSGLGMAITKQFVDLMGGTIQVESKIGEGSCFVVEVSLRLQTEEEALLLAQQTTIEDFSTLDLSSKRVLLVEDYEVNAQIAGEILGLVGISIEYAVNGKEAVEKISACEDGYYDLVFMDVMMPVMNGYEATRAIRALPRDYAKNLPIIAMTANAFEEDIQNAKAAGMNGHIAKPLEMNQLMAVIKNWLCE